MPQVVLDKPSIHAQVEVDFAAVMEQVRGIHSQFNQGTRRRLESAGVRVVYTARPYPTLVYQNVGLWLNGVHCCNLVLAAVQGTKDAWAVITDEPLTLQTLWQYALRFRVEELCLDSKSGAFELEDSRLHSAVAVERLYLVAAMALLYATTQGMAVQLAGLRQQVDPHWRRSYLKIGLRWLQGCFIRDKNCSLLCHSCPQIHNLFLPLNERSRISMIRFGSLSVR
jgi:hypothetical protein